MQALWLSLKESVRCGSRLSDVANRPERCKCSLRRSCTPNKESLNSKRNHQIRNSYREVIIRRHNSRTHFCELSIGDPARIVTEMIFRRASINPSGPSRKIKRVLRVKSSIEVLERFESYREMVKENAYEQCKTHPRSTVDGNELLRFFGTTMSCCYEKSVTVFQLCRDPLCRVCGLIQSDFQTDDIQRNGIRLSTNSEELSDSIITFPQVSDDKRERAVILCRIIAGPVVNKEDRACDSIGSEHTDSKIITVKNPCAVLPCFVIVFS
ncbi:hypothetical protein K2173_023762 [Erythroxylum novogranatense]|uniref:Uncharacterized protein n=1 Tax=Erythroxylum novogranatense TaxID=1862640 RepID=A0AAV8TKE9_9ROSI|nr:hypothetical protein K2173_023762 [Erythroxylum novogranatense]